MIKLKVPFSHLKILSIEKELDFEFKIATLECATMDVLKCDLWEIGKQNPYDLNIAILYAGYVIACKDKFKRPKHTFEQAIYWFQHMSSDSHKEFLSACTELMGQLQKGNGKEEKKK